MPALLDTVQTWLLIILFYCRYGCSRFYHDVSRSVLSLFDRVGFQGSRISIALTWSVYVCFSLSRGSLFTGTSSSVRGSWNRSRISRKCPRSMAMPENLWTAWRGRFATRPDVGAVLSTRVELGAWSSSHGGITGGAKQRRVRQRRRNKAGGRWGWCFLRGHPDKPTDAIGTKK